MFALHRQVFKCLVGRIPGVQHNVLINFPVQKQFIMDFFKSDLLQLLHLQM